MRTKLYSSILFLLLWGFTVDFLAAQSCGADAPFNFTIVPDVNNPSDCFLQINWLAGEMPEIACGSPGTAVGTVNGVLFDLSVTVNGLNEVLYNRGNGNNCNNSIVNIEYGTSSNSYITTVSLMNFCLAGNVITIEGNRSGGASFFCDLANSDVAAPVELVYFKGIAGEKSNRLQWATSSEENVSTFVVERSSDGKRNIETLGSLAAVGFSDAMEYYQLEDDNPRPLTYYRLRSIDFDATYSTSEWIVVQRALEGKASILEISPVPLRDEPLQVFYQADSEESILILITDINGRKLWEERKVLAEGTYNWTFELPGFQQDLLILQITNRDGVLSRLIPKVVGE